MAVNTEMRLVGTRRTHVGGARLARPIGLALLASAVTWAVARWGTGMLVDSLERQGDVEGVLAISRVGYASAPMLSAAIAVLLLPEVLRGRLLPSMVTGTAVSVAAGVISVAGADSAQQAAFPAVVLVVLAALTAAVTAAVMRRTTDSAEYF